MDQIKSFYFKGELSSSKSIFNRCLIVKSFYPEFAIEGKSTCLDVKAMQKAVKHLLEGKRSFDCGAAGTTFRFLLARLSREKGQWSLKCEKRLLQRPHTPLYEALKQLGVKVQKQEGDLISLSSNGWQVNEPIDLDLNESSQFVSALLLSAWNLEKPLKIRLGDSKNSLSYLNLTIELLKKLGMSIESFNNEITVPAGEKLKLLNFKVEPDMSSAFALACHALTSGELFLENFPLKSLQPDFYFIELLKKMGAEISSYFKIVKTNNLSPLSVNLENNPDLFPVLAILLSRVEGESLLSGLKLLEFKESDRLKNTIELLSRLRIKTDYSQDQLRVYGKKTHIYPELFEFDPDQDHRMAMAASLASHQGAKINILNKQVVDKSFPEFWDIVSS